MQNALRVVTAPAFKLGWIALLVSGCFQPKVADESGFTPSPASDSLAVVAFDKAGGSARVKAEVAADEKSRARGLMFRERLADGEGMLFVYPRREILSFWMMNTSLPLSIAFIDDDGAIVNIEKMKPLDERSRYRSLKAVRYALEVPQGWFERNGIRVGDRAKLALPAGLKPR